LALLGPRSGLLLLLLNLRLLRPVPGTGGTWYDNSGGSALSSRASPPLHASGTELELEPSLEQLEALNPGQLGTRKLRLRTAADVSYTKNKV